MIRTIYAYFSIGFSIFLSIFPLLYYMLFKKFMSMESQRRFVYTITNLWGKWMVALSSSKVTLIGEENIPDTNVLFVANHQSYYDIPLLLANIKRPIAFVAKIEMKKAPVMSNWMEIMGCIFLDRGNNRQSLKAIISGINNLKSGYNMVIFPEGTRSKDGEVATFKQGSLKLGVKAGVPIIPVTIVGSRNMYELPGKRFTKYAPKIIIHHPIHPNKLSVEEERNLSQNIQNIIRTSLREEIEL